MKNIIHEYNDYKKGCPCNVLGPKQGPRLMWQGQGQGQGLRSQGQGQGLYLQGQGQGLGLLSLDKAKDLGVCP